jgi:GNAT superfamily N-acetyltransferase
MQIDCTTLAHDALSAADRGHLADCFNQHFGHVDYQWAGQPWCCLARVDGELVGNLAILKRTVLVGDIAVDVGGIGAVTTHEDSRGRGVAAALLDCATRAMRDKLNVAFGLLICRPAVANVYSGQGWQAVPTETHFAQPVGTVSYPGLTMIISLQNQPWPAATGDIDLQGLPW